MKTQTNSIGGKAWSIRVHSRLFAVSLSLLVLSPSALAQKTVLGASSYDKFTAPFWSQNNNTTNLIAGLNANAGTNHLADTLLPLIVGGKIYTGTHTGTNTYAFRTWNAGSSAFETYNFDWTAAATPLNTNTVSRIGHDEELIGKTLRNPRFSTAVQGQSGVVIAVADTNPRFVPGETGTNTLYIQNGSATTTPTTYLQYKYGVLSSLQAVGVRLASSQFVTNYTDPVNNGKAFSGGVRSTGGIWHPMQNLTTSDFTLWVRAKIPLTVPATPQGLGAFSPRADELVTTNSLSVYLDTAGALVVRLLGGISGVDARSKTISGVVASYGGQMTDVIVVRSALTATLSVYLNSDIPAAVETTVTGTPPGWDALVSSTNLHIGFYSDGNYYNDIIQALAVFNRALSATDITRLRQAGIDSPDQWGSVAPIISATVANGGFETLGGGGADVFGTWQETVSGTSTVNNETGTPQAGTRSARMDVDGSGSSVYVYQDTVTTEGKRYLARYYAKRGATAGTLIPSPNSVTTATQWTNTLTTSWAQYQQEFIAAGSFWGLASGPGSAGASLYIDSVELIKIGAVAQPDLEVGIGNHIPDRGSNRLWGESGTTLLHALPARSGERIVQKTYNHGDISASATTTRIFQLPPNCGILDVEFDRETAFDGGTTVSVGISGTNTKYVNAQSVAATGKALVDSGSKAGESASAFTSVYILKSGATTVGRTTVRVRYVIRGN